jgi:hypothetical protein
MKDTGWTKHSEHLNAGVSCSVCHTAHGMGATSGAISGERLVNFDLNVVAPYNGLPISYNHGANSCVLVCHGVSHTDQGKIVALGVRSGPGARK